ncbi:MAG TPA: pentapeptide repeat-containing protein, partial [Ktedonobacterales bacterium]|nr:pentapeptide repeat-containing protein [Ktedonobacterales bacterium]
RAHLYGANLDRAHLRETDLTEADLSRANLIGADLIGADLTRAILTETSFINATLDGCRVYGVSAWNVYLDDAVQTNLRITPDHEAEITVDNLEVGQFLYLMLHSEHIREIVETLTSKLVLVLGHFTPERKVVRDTLCEALRQHEPPFLPVLFNVEEASEGNVPEIGTSLARLACFVIADLTSPDNIRPVLQAIVPHVQVPVLPIIVEGAVPDPMLDDYRDFPWVLDVHRYPDLNGLVAPVAPVAPVEDTIVAPAEAKASELPATEAVVSELPALEPPGGEDTD